MYVGQIGSSFNKNEGIKFIENIQIEELVCGRNLIVLLDCNKKLYLFNEKQKLFTIKINEKFKNVKIIDDIIYALSDDSQYLYEFKNKGNSINFSDYTENIYFTSQNNSNFKLFDTPYYNKLLFFTLDSKSKLDLNNVNYIRDRAIFTEYCDITNYNNKKFHEYKIRSKSTVTREFVLPANEISRKRRKDNSYLDNFYNSNLSVNDNSTLNISNKSNYLNSTNNNFNNNNIENVLRMPINEDTINSLKKIRNKDRITRISSLLGKIFDNKIEQIENTYKTHSKIELNPRSRKASIEKVNDAIMKTKILETITYDSMISPNTNSSVIHDKISNLINIINSKDDETVQRSLNVMDDDSIDEKVPTTCIRLNKSKSYCKSVVINEDFIPVHHSFKDYENVESSAEHKEQDKNISKFKYEPLIDNNDKFDNKKLIVCNNRDSSFFITKTELCDSINIIPDKEKLKTIDYQFKSNTMLNDHSFIPYKKPFIIQKKNRMVKSRENLSHSLNINSNNNLLPSPKHENKLVILNAESNVNLEITNYNKSLNLIPKKKKINKRNSFILNNNSLININNDFSSTKVETNIQNDASNTSTSRDDTNFVLQSYRADSSYMSDSAKGYFNNFASSQEVKHEDIKEKIKFNIDFKNIEFCESVIEDENAGSITQEIYLYNKTESSIQDKLIENIEETMRDKMIKNLESFKLINVKEKIKLLHNNYQELVAKSPLPEKQNNLLKSEKFTEYEPLELENTLRSINLSSSRKTKKFTPQSSSKKTLVVIKTKPDVAKQILQIPEITIKPTIPTPKLMRPEIKLKSDKVPCANKNKIPLNKKKDKESEKESLTDRSSKINI